MTKRVAIQGLKGSFHHEAASHFFQGDLELKECDTFEEVSNSVTLGDASFGLMAIENSIAGCILPNYKLLRERPLAVVGEVGLRVKLNLMGLTGGSFEDLEEVHSHQMAIRQCGNFFSQYPAIKLVEAFDTAGSAKTIAERSLKRTGAIASVFAAQTYGLEVYEEGIEDHELNYTRFLVLQKEGHGEIADPDRVSVYFQTRNDPGSLAQALTIISGLGINLGKLQSLPVPSKNSLYGFYATLEIAEPSQLEDLERIMQRMALTFEILGKYKKGATYG